MAEPVHYVLFGSGKTLCGKEPMFVHYSVQPTEITCIECIRLNFQRIRLGGKPVGDAIIRDNARASRSLAYFWQARV